MPKITFKNSLLFLLIVISTFLMYSNMIVYLLKMTGIPIYYFLTLIFSAFFLYKILKGDSINIIFSGLFIWIIYYFMLITIYFILSEPTQESFVIYRQTIFAIIVVLVMFSIYMHDTHLMVTRKTILFTLLLSTVTMFIDFFEPGFFAKPYGLYYIAGRASGMFMNANTAGTGLLIGLIFSIDIVAKKWRFLVLMFVFLGVTLTFSRASILAYILIIIILTIQKKVELRKIIFMFIVFVFFITSFLTFGIDYLAESGVNTKNIEDRVTFMESGGKSEKDESQQIREHVFEKALNMFADKPIFGNGYASTQLWDWPESTHNLLVSNWADYGIFGVILIPLLMFFLLRKSEGDARTVISLFIFIFMFRSLFTHNSLDIYYFITSMSLAMAMNIKSREGYIK